MDKDQIIALLRADNRTRVAKDTGLKYRYLRNLINGEIVNPGSRQLDTLRSYYLARSVMESRP